MTSRPAPTRALVGTNLGLVYVIWGSTYLGIAVAIETAQPLWAMGVRVTGSGVLLTLALVIFKGPRVLKVPRREAVSAACLGLVMLTVGIGSVSLGERYVPIGVAALLVATGPMWAVLIRTVTGDRPHAFTWMGVAVGLFGLVMLLRPTGEGMSTERITWSILILVGALIWTLGSFMAPKLSLPRDPLVLVAYEMTFGGAFFFLWSRLLHENVDLAVISTRSWVAIAYLMTAGVVGFTAFTWLITHVPLSLATTNAYVNPVVALFLGWVVLQQQITLSLVLGGALTLAGVALVMTGERSGARMKVESG